MDRIKAGLTDLQPHFKAKRLVFGDLYLKYIPSGREVSFNPGADAAWNSLHFLVWGVPYTELIQDLVHRGTKARITVAPCGDCGGLAQLRSYFGPRFLTELPQEADPVGEPVRFTSSPG